MSIDGKDGPIEFKMPNFDGIPSIPGGFRLIAIVFAALVLLFTSFYTVGPEQVGVVLRLGKYVRTANPGLNFKIPFGIETVSKIPIQRQLKEEFGFRTVDVDIRSQYSTRGLDEESNMLTGDLNAAVVEWVVQYRIVDPFKYLFRVRNVRETFRDMSEATMREVVGDRTVNEVLTVGRQEIADLVEQKLQELCDRYESGIKVDQVVLQDVNPPDEVKPSFNAVNEAQQEMEKLINQAQSQYNKEVPRASGEAEKTIQQAEGYALDRVNRAKGDASRFEQLYEAYRKAPEVTRKRIYIETMSRIIPATGRKIIVDDDVKGILPLLNLDQAGDTKGGGR